MSHIVLLGDSILDNRAYVGAGPDVVAQVRALLAPGARASLLAVDGSTTGDIAAQLARLPADATQLVLSVGGNDALLHEHILRAEVSNSADALLMLADVIDAFEAAYRAVVDECLRTGLPLLLCTVYDGNFSDPSFQRCARIAIGAHDDCILRVAIERSLRVLDLRFVCARPEHYANDIEPSVRGGERIAWAILAAIGGAAQGGARVFGAA